ncbi:hypothetical protein ONZ45_g2969 [Pleurotus djamor]|nr:hypothetical protein ONZ45_g2969 [Pleurotus djamor]
MAPIHKLPLELLLMIFGHVYQDFQYPVHGNRQQHFLDHGLPQDATDVDRLNSPSSPCYFPYGLAEVCHLWREILSEVPAYWQSLRILLNSTSFENDLARLEDEISWCPNLDFTLYLLPNPELPELEEYEELLRVSRILRFIHEKASSNPRFVGLRCQTAWTSTLPLLEAYMPSASLKKLELQCDTGTPNPQPNPITLHYPNLVDLTLSGDSLMVAAKSPSFSSLSIGRLTICNYERPEDDEQGLEDLQYLLTFITSISTTYLCFQYVDFSFYNPDDHQPYAYAFEFDLETLVLKQLSKQTVSCILLSIAISPLMVIVYSECGLNPDFDYADMSSEVMSLEHIHDEDELRNFIFGWSGNCITFTNCSCLTDDILRVLEELDWNYLDIIEVFGEGNVIIVSNSAGTYLDAGEIQAESVSHHLGVPVLIHNKFKPSYSCIEQIRGYFSALEKPIQDKELVIVGDRIFTDVIMANRMKRREGDAEVGPLSIWTTGVWKRESMVMRWLEKGLVNAVESMSRRWANRNGEVQTSLSEPYSEFIRS